MIENSLIKQIGNTIKNARLSVGISAEELSEKTEISRATLWSIETGSGNVSLNTYIEVAQVLGISISFTGAEYKNTVRKRCSKRITKTTIKKNKFEVFCIESYSRHTGYNSYDVYSAFKKEKLLDLLRTDYEDLHGMSIEYLMNFFDLYLEKKKV